MNALLVALAGFVTAQPATDAKPPKLELVGEVAKIWDAGKHNAFTDLIRFKEKWYCTFREGDAHVGGDGKLRVLSSADGTKWESVALLEEKGIDLRDPKLSVTADGRLMMVAGGSVYEGKKLVGRQPRVAFSKDGKEWTPTKRVLDEGEWLWRVTWHDGKCYGVSYDAAERDTKEAKDAAATGKVKPGPADWKLKLWVSKDGEKYELVTHLDVPGHPNETTLRFTPKGEMVAMVRREGGDQKGWVGTSQAPYKEWAWKELPARVGGPNFLSVPDGPTIAAVRLYDAKVRTSLCLLDPKGGKLDEVLKLPSGGDTSYAGLVWHDGHLWVSYYSSHEGKSAIYLAKVKIGGSVERAQKQPAAVSFPPTLPDGKTVFSHTGDEFLEPPATLRKDVDVAKAAPTVDFLYFPGQDYPGNPWSNWGDSVAADGKYYASIGDHLAVGGKNAGANGTGTGRVFEYDPAKKAFRQLLDTSKLLELPKGHYTPGKIHSRLDVGSDGWLYCATHRGSTTVTADKNHYEGDWVLRCDPKTGKGEVVVRGPVPKHCIPCSVLDGERMIFYSGTAAGTDAKDQGVRFFAYDVKAKKVLYSGPDGPARYMILAKSTGRVYWTPGKEDAVGPLVRYDPTKEGGPVKIDAEIGLRAATEETKGGKVFTVSKGRKGEEATLFAFDTRTEKAEELGPAAVGVNTYITSLDADPTGRYVYYIPGAHGGSEKDHSAVVQFDTKTKRRKVIAFLHPHIHEKTGATLVGTFSSAVDPKGDKLYVTWNVNRGGKSWDCCALTVIHIPESER